VLWPSHCPGGISAAVAATKPRDNPQSREQVYDFLDMLSNHEPFTDHMLRDWRCDGPARGVGAKARVTAFAAGRTDTIDIEVIEAERPARNVERNVGAAGRRVATGIYTLAELPGGRTRVTFEYACIDSPDSRVRRPEASITEQPASLLTTRTKCAGRDLRACGLHRNASCFERGGRTEIAPGARIADFGHTGNATSG